MNNHKKYIQRCIELAKKGLGTTYPNPFVGSVIVYGGKIIGEGWHRKAGTDHAEVVAINSVTDKQLLEESTLYVNLEPCSHFGKTPPCADLIIKYKIPNVVIGTTDPNPLVAGNGIKKLFDKGINVTVGVLEKECIELNKRFFTYVNQNRPYIILKWAQSADGFIAPSPQTRDTNSAVWLSGERSRQLVHKWRTEENAIMIGTNTAVADNPQLTARDYFGNHPVRIVLDRSLRIPKENHIFDSHSKTIVVSIEPCVHDHAFCETMDFAGDVVKQLLSIMYKHEITSVIIEGGTKTLQTFIDADIWDEMRIFRGELFLTDGIQAPSLKAKPVERAMVGKDELLIFKR